MRRKYITSLQFIILVGLFIAASVNRAIGDGRHEEKTIVKVPRVVSGDYRLPLNSKIKAIEAEMYGMLDIPGGKLPDVKSFELPKTRYDQVLRYFKNPEINTCPKIPIAENGSLKITLINGNVMRINYYWSMSKGPLHYSVFGVRCIDGKAVKTLDNGIALDQILREAYKESSGIDATDP